jgi:transcription elongation factor Elf1
MRRLRRRSSQARANRLFCGTNGCASFLDLNTEAGVATCHICGYTRRLH